MTAVSQKIKSVNSKNWTVALQNANKSKSESCTFIKHLICISVSNILFLRKVFSEDNFEAKVFEGMTIRFLKTKPVYPGAEIFGKWLNGAFDAVEKKYLRHFILEIKDADAEKTLELYTMSFDYDEGKESMSLTFKKDGQTKLAEKSKFTFTDIQRKTISLLQMCHTVTKTCSSLPQSVLVSMRISYNDNTPDGYQPDGYKPCSGLSFEFPSETRKIGFGVVETKYHTFKLISKTFLNKVNFFEENDVIENEENANNEQNEGNFFQIEKQPAANTGKCLEEICMETIRKPLAPTNLQIPAAEKEIESGSETDVSETQLFAARTSELRLDDEDEENNPSLPNSQDLKSQDLISTVQFPETQDLNLFNGEKNEQIIKCACGSSEKSTAIFRCSLCGNYAHAECYGLFQLPEMDTFDLFCAKCHEQTETAKCHDIIMLKMDATGQQRLAALRRVLIFCSQYRGKALTINRMEKIVGVKGIPKLYEVVARKLVAEKMAQPSNRKNNFTIDKKILADKMPQYFYTPTQPEGESPEKPEANKRKRQCEDDKEQPSPKRTRASMTNYRRIDRKV